MNLTNVKSLSIKGKKVKSLSINGKKVWEEKQEGSQGLSYRLINNDTEYEVSGIGTCTDTDVVIPAMYNGKPVTSIGQSAFQNCDNLLTVKIGNNVTTIYPRAFGSCDLLKSVLLGNSVRIIGYAAFEHCASLVNVILPDSVVRIEQYAFQYCTVLPIIFLPNSVATVIKYAFTGCHNLTIYCSAASKPSDWDANWNSSNRPVVWDCLNKMITFTIVGISYQAIEGMTWKHWVNSPYNTDEFIIASGDIDIIIATGKFIEGLGAVAYSIQGAYVYSSETIVSGTAYTLKNS